MRIHRTYKAIALALILSISTFNNTGFATTDISSSIPSQCIWKCTGLYMTCCECLQEDLQQRLIHKCGDQLNTFLDIANDAYNTCIMQECPDNIEQDPETGQYIKENNKYKLSDPSAACETTCTDHAYDMSESAWESLAECLGDYGPYAFDEHICKEIVEGLGTGFPVL